MPRANEQPFDERLVENIHEELLALNAGLSLNLHDRQIEQMARSIAANVDYAFEVRWSPRWEQPPTGGS